MKNLTQVFIGEFAMELSNAARLGDSDREEGIERRGLGDMMAHLRLTGAPQQEYALHNAYSAGYRHQAVVDANRNARGG